MSDIQHLRLERFTQQFEALAADLRQTQDARDRRDILRRMKVVIDETDKVVLEEYATSGAKEG